MNKSFRRWLILVVLLVGGRVGAQDAPDEVLLIYDAYSFTLVNATDTPLDLARLNFAAVDAPRQFEPSRFAEALPPGTCLQVWALNRLDALPLPECRTIRWISSASQSDHFWIATAGSRRFTAALDGADHALCSSDDATLAQRRCALNLE